MGGAGKGQKGSGSLQADTWQALPGSEGRGCEVSFGVQKKQKPRLSTCFLVCPNSGLPTGEEKDLQDTAILITQAQRRLRPCAGGGEVLGNQYLGFTVVLNRKVTFPMYLPQPVTSEPSPASNQVTQSAPFQNTTAQNQGLCPHSHPSGFTGASCDCIMAC